MTAAAGWWATPAPRAYRSKPVTVSALPYDGTPESYAAIRRWLAGSPSRPAQLRVDTPRSVALGPLPAGDLTIEQAGGDIVRVAPGDVLVLRGGSWHSCPGREFEAGYDLKPREVPIYDDGE